MNNTWSLEQRESVWNNYLNGKMLALFSVDLSNRDPLAKHFLGTCWNGNFVEVKMALYVLEAICPQCGKLMHHDFYQEPNFSQNSWTIGFLDNDANNKTLANLIPMHEICIQELHQTFSNQKSLQSSENQA